MNWLDKIWFLPSYPLYQRSPTPRVRATTRPWAIQNWAAEVASTCVCACVCVHSHLREQWVSVHVHSHLQEQRRECAHAPFMLRWAANMHLPAAHAEPSPLTTPPPPVRKASFFYLWAINHQKMSVLNGPWMAHAFCSSIHFCKVLRNKSSYLWKILKLYFHYVAWSRTEIPSWGHVWNFKNIKYWQEGHQHPFMYSKLVKFLPTIHSCLYFFWIFFHLGRREYFQIKLPKTTHCFSLECPRTTAYVERRAFALPCTSFQFIFCFH